MKKKANTVPSMMREAAGVYEERNAIYKDTYKRHGHVMAALFPEGVWIEPSNPKDQNRLAIVEMMVGKMTRYCANFDQGGHDDSLLDISVYANMLREIDNE